MDHQQHLTPLLSQLALTLDPTLSAQIMAFLNSLPLPPNHPQPQKLRVIAAAALKADVARVATIGGGGRVSYGAPFQQFLRHVGENEREDFLEAAARILEQWQEAPPHLRNKFAAVRHSYGIFTHYRTLFARLATETALEQEVAQRLMSASWILFLRAKTQLNNTVTNSTDCTELPLLMAALELAFDLLPEETGREKIEDAFCLEFGPQVVLPQSLRELYKKEYMAILQKSQGDKHDLSDESDLRETIKQDDSLRRLVDNLSISYARQKGANFDQINQLYYLQLQMPPLAPNPQPHAINSLSLPSHTVSKVLKFDDQDQSEEQSCNNHPLIEPLETTVNNNSSKPFQLCQRQNPKEDLEAIFSHFVSEDEESYAEVQRRRKKFVINKCHTRLLILKWVQNQIKQVQNHLQSFIYDLQLFSSVSLYQTLRMKKITALIEKLCSACKDKSHRSNQAYRLFLAFLVKVRQHIKKQDFLNITSNQNYLDAFLCLSCIVFNHAYKTEQLSFRAYCQHFDVSIITGFVPLNWLGFYADMPKELQLFLFQLEQRILFDEIWRCSTGNELFSTKEISYVEMAMKKRLFRHVSHCISFLSKGELSDKERASLFKFIQEILSSKRQLLNQNNLYIIIVCSINFCFGKTLPLSKLIETLRKNQQMSHFVAEGKDQYGYPISIEYYYSDTFIRQVDPIQTARKQPLFATPTKTPPTATRQSSSSPKYSPVLQIYKFGQDSFSKNEVKVCQYRKNLAVKIFEAPYKSNPSSEGDQ